MSVKIRKCSGQWGISNLFRFQNSRFSTKTGQFFFGQNISQHAAQVNGGPSISPKNISFSNLIVETVLKNVAYPELTNRKIDFFC